MPNYLTLAYEGNYAGRMGPGEYFTWKGETYLVHYGFGIVEKAQGLILLMAKL